MTQTANQALEVGKKLVELCSQGKHMEAINTLYSDNIVSIEAMGDETMPARQEGIEAIRGKNQWWVENHEVHGGSLKGPFPHGDRFAVYATFEVTPKTGPMAGNRMNMEEMCLYTVKDSKIVQEEFFYHMDC